MSNPKSSGLAIAALILGIVGFCMPITAPIAVILGIVALNKIGKSNGQVGGQGLAIGGIVTGGLACFMIPVLAAIAIPNFIRYQLRSKQSEARVNIQAIKTGAEIYRAQNDAYPKADTGFVPAEPCGADKCALDSTLWSQPPWSDLGFSPPSNHYYQYRYTSEGSSFSIEAQADLDDDGSPGRLRLSSDAPEIIDVNAGQF